MADELFDARNALTVGNYDQAIADASLAKTNQVKAADVAVFNAEKDAVLARAQIGLGQYEGVIAQQRSSTNPLLQAVATYAELKSTMRSHPVPVRLSAEQDITLPPAVGAVVEKISGMAKASASAAQPNAQVALLACLALLDVGESGEAIKLARTWLRDLPQPQGVLAIRQSLELRCIVIEGLLRLNRSDQAKREIKEMEKLDDEALTTLMYTGIVALYEGRREGNSKETYGLAVNAFKDAAMRSGNSVMLMNLQALAHMGLQEFDQAEKCLLDALSVRSGDPDTIANLAAVSAQVGKSSDVSEHYMTQASGMHGAWARYYANAGQSFDSAAAAFVPAE